MTQASAIGRRANTSRVGKRVWAALTAVLVTVLLLAYLSNFLWAISTSFKPTEDILTYPPTLIPETPVLDHYLKIFNESFGRWFLNSAIVAVLTVVIVLAISIPAAYGLTRFNGRGRTLVLFTILLGMALGQVSTIVPFYFVGSSLRLIDTYALLVIVYSAWMTPLTVWLLRGYFRSIPTSIDEAAMLDGCSRVRIMLQLIVPLARPAIAAAAFIIFVYCWNEYILAAVLTSSDQMRTVPVGIHLFLTTYGVDWGGISAGTIASLIPVVILFAFLQKQFVAGLTEGTLGK